MKKLFLSAAAVSAMALSSSAAFAVCPAQGEVTKVRLNAALTEIWVRPSTTNVPTIAFTTNNDRLTSAAVAAQGSHERVRVLGAAANCTAPVNGLSQGGVLNEMVVAPEP